MQKFERSPINVTTSVPNNGYYHDEAINLSPPNVPGVNYNTQRLEPDAEDYSDRMAIIKHNKKFGSEFA